MSRKTNLLKLFLVICCQIILITQTDYADLTSTNYRTLGNSINAGGPVTGLESTNYLLNCSIGLLSCSGLSSASYRIYSELMNVMYQPGSITTLKAIPGDYPGQVKLTWTAPWKDDGTLSSGTYVVRYSTISNFNSEESFEESNTTITWTASFIPQSPGTGESLTLTGLIQGVTYYIAIKTRDSAGNQSRLSNVWGSSNTAYAQVQILSISVSPTILDGTTVQADTLFNTNATPIVIVSSSNVLVNYKLKCSSFSQPSNWYVTGSTPTDNTHYRFLGLFNTAQPADTDFNVNIDTITDIEQISGSDTNGRYGGDVFGVNVSSYPAAGGIPGPNQTLSDRTRKLWISFTPPSSSSSISASPQTMSITIIAEQQP